MIRFSALSTDAVRCIQSGGPDANGQPPLRRISDGDGVPCRHCLEMVGPGEAYLVAAFRPFPAPQPYAETGPIFLHERFCDRRPDGAAIPPFLASPRYILRGYDRSDRIVYGSGRIVATATITEAAAELLADRRVAYVHVRSATNTCYHCRVDRA